MTINNYAILKPLLNFDNEGEFYFLQLIKRKAENPDMPKSQRLIKNYYIYSLEYLEEHMDGICELCDYNKARAYLRLNRRQDKVVALQALKMMAENISNESYKVKDCYDKACGKFHSEKPKRWLIDIDDGNFMNRIDVNVSSLLRDGLIGIQPTGDKYLCRTQTPNGCHLITTPFNVEEFKKRYPYDVHKDNPTILYAP